jgi:hypothetical protein
MIKINASCRMRWAGRVASIGGMRNAYSILVEKPEGKSTLGRTRSRWEDIIRIDFRGIR